jgi:hypothetical protein
MAGFWVRYHLLAYHPKWQLIFGNVTLRNATSHHGKQGADRHTGGITACGMLHAR